jgi:hypothetical protein
MELFNGSFQQGERGREVLSDHFGGSFSLVTGASQDSDPMQKVLHQGHPSVHVSQPH